MFAARQFDADIGDEAHGDAVGDGEGQRDRDDGEQRREQFGGVVPGQVAHAAEHQQGHEHQGAAGGEFRHHARQRRQEYGEQEQDADSHCGQPGAAAAGNARHAFHVTGHRGAAEAGADHAGGTVGLQRPVQVTHRPLPVHQAGAVGNAHQGAGGVEQVDEQERGYHADHAHVQGAGNIQLQKGRGHVRRRGHQPLPGHQPGEQTRTRHCQDAQQDGAGNAAHAQAGNEQETDAREHGLGPGQVAQGEDGGGTGYNDTAVLQADKPDEQAHPATHGQAQVHGDAVQHPAAQAGNADDDEQHPGKEHRAQSHLPAIAQAADHRVGEECVHAHARRQPHRPVGVQAHDQAGQRRGQAGGNETGALVDARGSHHLRVDEDDVGHGDKGGATRQQLGADFGTVFGEPEAAFQESDNFVCHVGLMIDPVAIVTLWAGDKYIGVRVKLPDRWGQSKISGEFRGQSKNFARNFTLTP